MRASRRNWAPSNLIQRRDLALPRGVWEVEIPDAPMAVFLLVTSTGLLDVRYVPRLRFAARSEEVLAELYEALCAIDPETRPRPVGSDDVTMRKRARRALARIGIKDF